MLKCDPPICSLSVTFIVKWRLDFGQDISAAIEEIMWFLYFSLLTWWILLVDLSMLTHTLISRSIKLLMMNGFHVIFEFPLTVLYWKNLHCCSLWRLNYNFHLYIASFLLFDYQGNTCFTKPVWNSSSLLYLWNIKIVFALVLFFKFW